MGRFKIYDPKQLVNVLNDTNYAKCLMCERKLKNIMGNIKRHYEQIHCMFINQNEKRKKSRKKSSLSFKNDKNKIKRKRGKKENDKKEISPVLKDDEHNTGTYGHVQNLTMTENINSKPVLQTKDQKQLDGYIEVKLKENHQLNLNLKKKLNIESDKIPATCYINNIQLPLLETFFQKEFINCLAETKIKFNLPISSLEESDSFQKALESETQPIELNYSPQTIGKHLDSMTLKLHQEIIEMLSNRLVYLKLDVVGSKETSIMLVNIQFIKEFKIKVITLSALELINDHLGTNLKQNLLSALEKYKIEISKVYSITKDYANCQFQNSYEHFIETTLNQDDSNQKIPHTVEYCQHLSEQFPGHVIHFVACDVIRLLNENISQSRDSAKSLRRQMSKLNMEPLPELDNTISWLSIFNMIKSLYNVRQKVENNSVIMVEIDWTFILKFVVAFSPIVNMVLMLQSNHHFIMGDLYREWLLCKAELEEISITNELAIILLKALCKRKLVLFESSLFLAALYLDPRFCYMGSMHMSDKQKEMATAHLLQIFNKLKEIESNSGPTLYSNTYNGRYFKLEKKVAQNMPSNNTPKMTSSCALNDVDCLWVKEALDRLQFEERLPFDNNILDYWKITQYKSPILAKIAETALAVPAAQETINRALDAWPMMLKCKFQLHRHNIENILLLALNQELVEKISLHN